MDEAFAWADEPIPPQSAPRSDLLPDGSFQVWPENWDTVCLFWAVRRCWRLLPKGRVMGFDWCQVQARMNLKGMDPTAMAREAARLEMMENAVLEVVD